MANLNPVLTRRRTVHLVLLVLCAGLSVHSVPAIERIVGALFVPTRVLAEFAAPLGWLRLGEVAAAEERIDHAARLLREEAGQLLADEQAAALPTLSELRIGRRLIHGEVMRRSRGNPDRVEVRVASSAGIVAGLPVVTGDWYLGRVARLDTDRRDVVHVDLLTGSDFLVGAEVSRVDWNGEPLGSVVGLVVGGLFTKSLGDRGQLHLALHNPTLRGVNKGEVFVAEPDGFDSQLAALSHGFRLGTLESVVMPRGSTQVRIRSQLDFKSGLFQVIVLAPEGELPDAERLELDTFTASRWLPARALTRGDVTPTREGRRLSKGELDGVRSGSAVAFGAHLMGRVGEAGWVSSDLLGLGDPGLRLAVLAKIEGEPSPRPLGELISLGRRRSDGLLRFSWTCRIDIEADGSNAGLAAADLYTGSGENGVPRGLFIGTTRLPTERGEHVILVEQDNAVGELGHFFVWRGHESSAPAGGTP